MCVATAIQTAAQSTGMFIGARSVSMHLCYDKRLRKQFYYSFLIGFGLTFASNGSPVFPCERSLTIHQLPPLRCWSQKSLTPHTARPSLEFITLSGISEL